ncbi:renalase-like [Uloborus diversus]|uniref:renalase-like n=1 Tax=Uloborus diversus TaxID=327109 RepID=UPI00240A0E6B|nr:renalase-like [Uloborus diversus]
MNHNLEKSILSKILIVGSGLTGSVTASLVKHEASADITIWEKEEYIGGRFHTFHSPLAAECSVDLGAQYISATLEFIRSHARFYDELLDKDKLVPLGEKIQNFRRLSESKTNFTAPGGSESLVQHFLEKSDATVCLKHEVVEINLKEEPKLWEVKASNGVVKNFDVVILTIPVPQVLKLGGNFLNISNEEVKMTMEQIKFSSRHAVGLMYNEPSKVIDELPWSIKYFPDDEIICFAAVDNRKRGMNKDLPTILIHTTGKYSQNQSDKSEDEIQQDVISHFKCLTAELPEPSYVKCIKWTYSQVIDPYIDNPGCIVLQEHPCLICGGDSFTESNFNGCITSALRIVEELLKHVTIAKPKSSTKKTSNAITISEQ